MVFRKKAALTSRTLSDSLVEVGFMAEYLKRTYSLYEHSCAVLSVPDIEEVIQFSRSHGALMGLSGGSVKAGSGGSVKAGTRAAAVSGSDSAGHSTSVRVSPNAPGTSAEAAHAGKIDLSVKIALYSYGILFDVLNKGEWFRHVVVGDRSVNHCDKSDLSGNHGNHGNDNNNISSNNHSDTNTKSNPRSRQNHALTMDSLFSPEQSAVWIPLVIAALRDTENTIRRIRAYPVERLLQSYLFLKKAAKAKKKRSRVFDANGNACDNSVFESALNSEMNSEKSLERGSERSSERSGQRSRSHGDHGDGNEGEKDEKEEGLDARIVWLRDTLYSSFNAVNAPSSSSPSPSGSSDTNSAANPPYHPLVPLSLPRDPNSSFRENDALRDIPSVTNKYNKNKKLSKIEKLKIEEKNKKDAKKAKKFVRISDFLNELSDFEKRPNKNDKNSNHNRKSDNQHITGSKQTDEHTAVAGDAGRGVGQEEEEAEEDKYALADTDWDSDCDEANEGNWIKGNR